MKKNILNSLLLFSLLSCMLSCQENESVEPFNNVHTNITFKYQGNIYNSTKAQQLYNQLQENPSLATYISSEGIPEYFDSHELMVEGLNKTKVKDSATTRVSSYYKAKNLKLIMYDNKSLDKAGGYTTFHVGTLQANGSYEYNDLSKSYGNASGWNWDKRMSSFEITFEATAVNTKAEAYPRPYITFYSGPYMTGQSITFEPYIDRPMYESVTDMGKYGWDNKVSCFYVFSLNFDLPNI